MKQGLSIRKHCHKIDQIPVVQVEFDKKGNYDLKHNPPELNDWVLNG